MKYDYFNNNLKLFAGLPGPLMDKILELGTEKEFRKGSGIFSEGEKGLFFCILLKGAVRLFKTSADGKDVIVRLLRENEMFGEVVLFENDYFPVNATAVQNSRVVIVPKKTFLDLLEEQEFRTGFIAGLMHKQRYLTERILQLSSMDVEERFFTFLKETYGERTTYSIDISKQELASAIGTLPETLSRLLARLKKRGVISMDGRKLTLLQ